MLNAKTLKEKNKSGGGGLQQPPTILEGEGNIDARNNFVKFSVQVTTNFLLKLAVLMAYLFLHVKKLCTKSV